MSCSAVVCDPPEHRFAALAAFISARPLDRFIVSVNSAACATYVAELLVQLQLPAIASTDDDGAPLSNEALSKLVNEWNGKPGALIVADDVSIGKVDNIHWVLRWEPLKHAKLQNGVQWAQDTFNCEKLVLFMYKNEAKRTTLNMVKLPTARIRAIYDKQLRLGKRVYRVHFWGFHAYKCFMRLYKELDKEDGIYKVDDLPSLRKVVLGYSIYPPPKIKF